MSDGDEVENGTDPNDGSDDFPAEGDSGEVSDAPLDGDKDGRYQGGCGCALATPPASALGSAFLVLGLLALVRRRR